MAHRALMLALSPEIGGRGEHPLAVVVSELHLELLWMPCMLEVALSHYALVRTRVPLRIGTHAWHVCCNID